MNSCSFNFFFWNSELIYLMIFVKKTLGVYCGADTTDFKHTFDEIRVWKVKFLPYARQNFS
jgi:hypothetical protein